MSDTMTKLPAALAGSGAPPPSNDTAKPPDIFDDVYAWVTKKDPAKQQRKEQKKQNKREVKEAGYIKHYEDALSSAEAALTALEQMNRSGEFLDNVKLTIANATAEAAAGRYKAGRDILAPAKIDVELKKAQAAHNQSLVYGRAAFPDAFDKADALRGAAQAASVLTDADKQDFVQRADEATEPLAGPAPQVWEGVAAGKVLDAAHQELTDRIAVCIEAKRVATAALQDLDRFEKAEAATLPTDYLAEFQYKLTQGRTQFEGGEFEAASSGLVLLLAEAKLRQKQANDDWDRLQAKLGANKKTQPKRPSILDPALFQPPTEGEASQPKQELEKQSGFATAEIDRLLAEARVLRDRAIKKNDEIPPLEAQAPTASGTIGRLMKLREAAVKGEIGTTMTASDALAALDGCEAEIGLNKGRIVKYQDEKLVTARKAIQEVVDENGKKIAIAIKHLKESAAKLLPQNTDLGQLTETFEAEFKRLTAAWQKQKNAAVELFQLKAPEDVGKRLGELRQDIRGVYRADGQEDVVANVQVLADQTQKRALDAAIAACGGKIDQIVAISLEKGVAAESSYQAIKQAATGPMDATALSQCAADIADLSRQVDGWIAQETVAATALRKDIKTRLIDAKAKLDQLSKLVIREKAQDDYLGLEERFADDIAEQELLSGNGDKTVLEGVSTALTKTASDIEKAAAAVNGEKGSEETLYTNEDARKAIKKRRNKLLDKTLTKYLSVRQVELRDGMDTIEEDLAARLPQETYVLLQAWDVKCEAAQTEAGNAKTELVTFTAKVDRVISELEDPAFEQAKGYRGALNAKLKGCIEAARTGGDLVAAERTLGEVGGEIATAKTNPQKVAEGQVAVDQAAQQAKVNKAEWEGYLNAFEARVTEQTSWRSTQREELQKLAKQADQMFKKSGDLASARKQLATAERRADYYRDYPDGQDVAVRAKLPKVVNACGTAFNAMRAEMRAVGEAVAALDDLNDGDKKLVASEIAALVNEFNVATLTPVAVQMNEKGRDTRAMRSVRETGLRDVGRMLAVLENDLRCQQMMTNPFSAKVKNAIVAARLALLKVEFTLQTSL